jgi:ectoine hydroxylase-related dioxygenase (phytanoyl-CoA dioxygenase family)
LTFVKQPGLGGSVAWHQDGVTHWNSPDLDEGTHGFNFQCHLCPTSGHSCLWVVPETHRSQVDIPALVADAGDSDRLREAIPLYCNPGDVTIVNRQTLHGSFANTSPELRIAVSFGFHRRRSVLGQHGALLQPPEVIYDEDFIFKRSAVVQVAIDARHQYYPDETPFVFQPFVGLEDQYRWNDDETYERVIRDYHTRDISI